MLIYKYVGVLENTELGEYVFNVPASARVLDVQFQGHSLVLWADVGGLKAPETEIEKISVLVVPTGYEFDDSEYDLIYIKTIQRGDFVWHIYKKNN